MAASGSDDRDTARPSARGPVGDANAQAPHSRWWIAAITFIVGAVVGVLAVGLLGPGQPSFPGSTGQPSPGGPAPTASSGETAALTGKAEVNAACLRVINAAEDIYTILSGVDEAVRDVDLQQLDDIVRRLQPIQPRLERDLRDCRVDTSVVGGPSASAPGQPPTGPATTGPGGPTLGPQPEPPAATRTR
jgi:hypothetical protein